VGYASVGGASAIFSIRWARSSDLFMVRPAARIKDIDRSLGLANEDTWCLALLRRPEFDTFLSMLPSLVDLRWILDSGEQLTFDNVTHCVF
jgi:hypothetical protein